MQDLLLCGSFFSSLCGFGLVVEEALYLLKHGFDITEGSIDAGKADVGNLVHVLQAFHNQFADDAAGYLAPPQMVEFLFDLFDRIFDFADGQRAFLACFTNADIKLLPVKVFTPLIALNDHQMRFFDALIGTEAPFAGFALASTMNGVTDVSRIFDPRFCAATERTFHQKTGCGDPSAFKRREEAPAPFLAGSYTRHCAR